MQRARAAHFSDSSKPMATTPNPVLLIVLDGWGHSEQRHYNAIAAARTPYWDSLLKNHPHTLIRCSGNDVGLPDGQMGNSEVGHMHIGAGRLIDQDFSRIGKALQNGDFGRNPALVEACAQAARPGRRLHILGLVSPGGVHSHEEHINGLMSLAQQHGVKEILIHVFLDGRDTPPQSALASLIQLEAHCAQTGARIASVVGRYYAMDRNKNWDRTAEAYDLIVNSAAPFASNSAQEALIAAYARGETDEFVRATVIGPASSDAPCVKDGDVVIFANFRADRARQLTLALTADECPEFERRRWPALTSFVTMTDYGQQFSVPVAFPAIELKNTFGAVLAAHELKQLRISETEKYAHVTFFLNGGEEAVFPGEDRILVPSPNVATYDLKPEMSAREVTERLSAALESESYDALVCNFANADMVGHTGNFDAAVTCIEALDKCLEQVVTTAQRHGVEVLITADHGNAEQMRAETSDNQEPTPHTAHTSNLVPLIYVGRAGHLRSGGSLLDIAPTLLTLMGITLPDEMTGKSLVVLEQPARDAA